MDTSDRSLRQGHHLLQAGILLIGQEDVTGGIFRSVVGVRVADGTEQPFTDRKWSGNYTPDLAWLSDNSGVLVTASEQAGSNPQISRISDDRSVIDCGPE